MEKSDSGHGDLGFPSTHDSMIEKARHPGTPGYAEAWQRFFNAYWHPLYLYLRRKRRSADEAEEILILFFEERLDEKLLSKWDPAKCRFHRFLLAELKDLMIDVRRKERARPEHGAYTLAITDEDRCGLEAVLADAHAEDPEQQYESEWAGQVLYRSVKVVEARLPESDTLGRDLLTQRVLPRGEPRAIKDLALAHGVTEEAIYTRISRLYDAIREQIVWQVREYSPDAAEDGDEVNEVLRCLLPAPPPWKAQDPASDRGDEP